MQNQSYIVAATCHYHLSRKRCVKLSIKWKLKMQRALLQPKSSCFWLVDLTSSVDVTLWMSLCIFVWTFTSGGRGRVDRFNIAAASDQLWAAVFLSIFKWQDWAELNCVSLKMESSGHWNGGSYVWFVWCDVCEGMLMEAVAKPCSHLSLQPVCLLSPRIHLKLFTSS